MDPKDLTVLGLSKAGKKTIIGSLIHMCGLELMQVSRFKENGFKSYGDIVSFYEANQTTPLFYGPSDRFKVELTTNPHVAFWVVAAADADKGSASRDELTSLISNQILYPQELLVIIINKMDLVGWSEQVVLDFSHTFSRVASLMPMP
ncbi:hypothetical protein LZ30DRAFT_605953 [Colletotrichum cereale]|nr:hypothetical protein LZ30DRAFT_605953 [Colletotrichum cereale]